jgi:SAM-dependent methyltransferase
MNPWSNPDNLLPEDAANLAKFIDTRSQVFDQAYAHAALVDALAPQAGEQLLDLGCGTGVIARRLIEHVRPGGSVLGIDISRAMLDFAERQPLPVDLRYQQAQAAALPCADASMDGAAAARLLMHVQDAQSVLYEVRRVLRPGGRLAMLEADWGTLALDHSDRSLTRRIIDWRTDAIDGDNWMGRQLVRRCLETGWDIRQVHVLVSVARDEQGTLPGSLRRCADLAWQHGVISANERQRWLEEIEARLAKGRFFATMNEYIVVADSSRP